MNIIKEYPLEDKWQNILKSIENTKISSTNIKRELYLDLAEPIVRAAVSWQNEYGTIIDPYYGKEANSGTARFLGAIGQLLKAGRCVDLVDVAVKSYETCLKRLGEVPTYTEFWTKELMYAYQGLEDKVEKKLIKRWAEVWHKHNPKECYGSLVNNLPKTSNFRVFALVGEFLKDKMGFSTNLCIDELIAGLLEATTEFGMFRDPKDPMAYDLVVKQQLDLICSYGYSGKYYNEIREFCRRGSMTSLLYQSTTGHMPFGGRSNQYHWVEGHFSCLCESEALFYKEQGDMVVSGIFKRAARKGTLACEPWILDMMPYRQLRQGFHPETCHGLDNYGHIGVYGLLAASLFGTAYHLAEKTETVKEMPTPCEVGGYAFELWPEFHKIFVTAGRYHIEVDTCGQQGLDSTGLGRIHRENVWPETAMSGTITRKPTYLLARERVDDLLEAARSKDLTDNIKHESKAIKPPLKDLAFGPAWFDGNGQEKRLSEFEDEIEHVSLGKLEESTERVIIEVCYKGRFGDCTKIIERYEVSSEGIQYGVELDNKTIKPHLTVPLIKTDGDVKSDLNVLANGFQLTYRNVIYTVTSSDANEVFVSDEPASANRNAIYRTGIIKGTKAKMILNTYV